VAKALPSANALYGEARIIINLIYLFIIILVDRVILECPLPLIQRIFLFHLVANSPEGEDPSGLWPYPHRQATPT
jgi:hypothetical protein